MIKPSRSSIRTGTRLSIKMSSYQYINSHYRDNTVSRPSYLYNGNLHTWGKQSLYWDGARDVLPPLLEYEALKYGFRVVWSFGILTKASSAVAPFHNDTEHLSIPRYLVVRNLNVLWLRMHGSLYREPMHINDVLKGSPGAIWSRYTAMKTKCYLFCTMFNRCGFWGHDCFETQNDGHNYSL